MDAGKAKLSRPEALALAKTMTRIVVTRGPKVVTIYMKQNPPADDELAALILGPTGNLRAPSIRRGKTLVVGFSEAAYALGLK